MVTVGTGAGNCNLIIQIGQSWYKNIIFRRLIADVYYDEDISTKTFSFSLRKNKGDRIKIFNLTNGNGITVPVYSLNEIRLDLTGAQTSIEEGEYYFELRRTDLNAPWISGNAYFVFNSPQ